MSNHNSIKDSTGFWVSRLARSMEQHFEKRLQAIGITRSAYAVLSAIHHDEKSTPLELTRLLGIDGAAVSRHLDRLQELGLVARTTSATDRRSVDVRLTPAGVRTVREGRAASEATNSAFTECLTADQIELLRTTIQTMLAHAGQSVADI